MHFTRILAAGLSLVTAAMAATVTYDIGYDNAGRPMDFVACSDGRNGLMNKYRWETQGDIPRFPYIGGHVAIPGWNSPNCGTCWMATYENRTIFILAIDHTGRGLNIGYQAMDDLTGGEAQQLGRIDAMIAQVPRRNCGL